MQQMSVYQSIAFDIAQRIVTGEFPVHTKLSGRTLLASQYHVSPETIRKAMGLLKEEGIVEVSQGKEITVISVREANEYLKKHNYLKSVYSLKQDIELLLKDKKRLDEKFEKTLGEIINYTDRLQNLKIYSPVEIKVAVDSPIIGTSLANLEFWQKTGATIIALRRGVDISISPGPHFIIRENDIIVLIGEERVYEHAMQFINNYTKINYESDSTQTT